MSQLSYELMINANISIAFSTSTFTWKAKMNTFLQIYTTFWWHTGLIWLVLWQQLTLTWRPDPGPEIQVLLRTQWPLGWLGRRTASLVGTPAAERDDVIVQIVESQTAVHRWQGVDVIDVRLLTMLHSLLMSCLWLNSWTVMAQWLTALQLSVCVSLLTDGTVWMNGGWHWCNYTYAVNSEDSPHSETQQTNSTAR